MKSLFYSWGQRVAFLCVIVLITCMAVLGACANQNAVGAAETPAQKAYALYGTFVVFEQQGAKLVANPATPAAVKQAIRDADAKAYPVARDLNQGLLEYLDIKNQLGTGATANDKLIIATSNLSLWVAQLQPLVTDLISAIGAK